MAAGIIGIFIAGGDLRPARAAAIQNSATGTVGGSSLDLGNATITLNGVPSGSAVTSVVAEISPNAVAMGSGGNVFIYDVLPTIGGSDTGVDRVAITAPSGYANLAVTSVSVGGAPAVASCPAPAAGEYCATATGQVMTIALGTKVMATLTNIRVNFTADAPGSSGNADFGSTVDDSATGSAAQAATAGNADGDPADANSVNVTVLAGVSPALSTVVAAPPFVPADGVTVSTITVTLRDSNGQPVAGKTIALSSDRGAADTITQPALNTDAGGVATGTVRSATVGTAVITASDTTDVIVLAMQPTVGFNQGLVLNIDKAAGKTEALLGETVTYRIEVRNTTAADVVQVKVDDRIPPSFKYLQGSARLNGAPAADPTGNRTLTFDLGTVPALADSNGNGRADPGEPGYMALSYQLVIGSGATPGEYTNTAVARDVCALCVISNRDEAAISVVVDPLFDLGTIIGKVFEDKDRDGRQGPDEPGVAGAMVALDDGTYAVTDEHGRYHFPAVTPGQRMLKINLNSIAAETAATTGETLVVSMTPGLLAKANFGVLHRPGSTETIGHPGLTGVAVGTTSQTEPVDVTGSLEAYFVLINGQQADLPTIDVRMGLQTLEEVVELEGDRLTKPIEFQIEATRPEDVLSWSLIITDAAGQAIRTLQGQGAPPASLSWNGDMDDSRTIEGGQIYQYRVDLRYPDEGRSSSPPRLFGVNRTTAVSLSLSSGAFRGRSDELSPKARQTLKRAAAVLRRFPNEKIVVEGHADATVSKDLDMDFSRKRAEAAVRYLVEVEGIAPERFVVRWYGSARPIASNDTEKGRRMNRRVEVNERITQPGLARMRERARTEPQVRINESAVRIDSDGHFQTRVSGEDLRRIPIEVTASDGSSLRTVVPIPRLEILEPRGEQRLAYGTRGDGYRVFDPADRGPTGPGGAIVVLRLRGRTEPDNEVLLDGQPVSVNPDATFEAELPMKLGHNSFGLVVRNLAGYTRITNLLVVVSDRDERGGLRVVVEPVPNLTVKLPPAGGTLKSPVLVIAGATDPGNRIQVNEKPVTVGPDGQFSLTTRLPSGRSRILIQVTDPEGRTGAIEREVEVSETQVFFMAFADGEVGQMSARGYLQGAGMDKRTEFYSKGRVAYYLKGFVAGKYLITSAFDTGKREFGQMFKDLDRAENDRLLTNLDPDKLYPVYGDSGTVVYDAQSQGRFYLALDSDELDLLVGSYPLTLTDTELAAYQRTLFGVRGAYRSVSRSPYGQPDTQVVVFGAEVRQAHVRDEILATGGSLYFLSHRDLVEGSEQVTMLVRDKNTGLILSRLPQQQGIDYTVKYEEGRILFGRPILSVVEGGSLVDQSLLPGHPVSIQIDYETRVQSFEKTAGGGRIRQQIGDHVAIGGTYVKDEASSGTYELQGVDAEIRLAKNSRIVGELAETRGTDSVTFQSKDGGLTFTDATPVGDQEGQAWKLAAEIDPGEWFGWPNRVQVGAYVKRVPGGFLSSGNFVEQGTRKAGAHLNFRPTNKDRITARYDQEDLDRGALGTTEASLRTLQWSHDEKRWGLTGEYYGRESVDSSTGTTDRSDYAAGRLRWGLTEKLTTRLEHQETMRGKENDQTTAGLDYQVLPPLSLQARAIRGTLGEAIQAGLVLGRGRGRAYLTQRLKEDQSVRSTATIVGGESALGRSGKVYTEYQVEHADNGDRALSLIGLQRHWDPAPGLQFLLSAEHTEIDSKPEVTRRDAIATGLSYVHPSGFKATTRDEIRREPGARERLQYLTSNQVEFKLNPDFTLLGKYRYSRTEDRDLGTIDAEFEERSLGLAFRPVTHDRFNGLFRYTRLLDHPPLAPGETESVRSVRDVLSVDWSLEINRFLEWAEKEALRVKTERAGAGPSATTHTLLSIHRLNYHLWKQLDLGVEQRTLRQREANDLRQGWLAELAWKTKTHLRLGGGFNFTDFSDNEFSENDYSTRGWFIRMQGTF